MCGVGPVTHLCRVEGGAQRANGLSVGLRLLVDLQQLGGLSQRLQGFLGAAVGQLPVRQPLLQLPHVVPGDVKSSGSTTPIETLPNSNLWVETSDTHEKNSRSQTCYTHTLLVKGTMETHNVAPSQRPVLLTADVTNVTESGDAEENVTLPSIPLEARRSSTAVSYQDEVKLVKV